MTSPKWDDHRVIRVSADHLSGRPAARPQLRLGLTQNTFTPNFPHLLDEQARHVADVVKAASEQQAQMVEPTLEAESGWLETIRATAIDNLAFRQACTPGYYNGEGRAGEGQGLFDGLYGPGSDAFFTLMKTWREAGDMRGLNVR